MVHTSQPCTRARPPPLTLPLLGARLMEQSLRVLLHNVSEPLTIGLIVFIELCNALLQVAIEKTLHLSDDHHRDEFESRFDFFIL